MGALEKTSLAIVTPLETISPLQKMARSEGLWFKSIPPERIGLNGEYDYYGLAKRVRSCLREQATSVSQTLKVRQRGRVIVLSGYLNSSQELKQVVKLAMAVDGVDAVETQGIVLSENRQFIPA